MPHTMSLPRSRNLLPACSLHQLQAPRIGVACRAGRPTYRGSSDGPSRSDRSRSRSPDGQLEGNQRSYGSGAPADNRGRQQPYRGKRPGDRYVSDSDDFVVVKPAAPVAVKPVAEAAQIDELDGSKSWASMLGGSLASLTISQALYSRSICSFSAAENSNAHTAEPAALCPLCCSLSAEACIRAHPCASLSILEHP